jgi:hypothetical protein
MPLPDNQAAITVGPRGLVVIQHVQLMDTLAHFYRVGIPERRRHTALGGGGMLTVGFLLTVMVDPDQFEKVFSMLIGNAFKFRNPAHFSHDRSGHRSAILSIGGLTVREVVNGTRATMFGIGLSVQRPARAIPRETNGRRVVFDDKSDVNL